jgi:hypothetical protein
LFALIGIVRDYACQSAATAADRLEYGSFLIRSSASGRSGRHPRGTQGLRAVVPAIKLIVEEDADYGFEQTHHTGSGSCGSGNERRAAHICPAIGTDWQVL